MSILTLTHEYLVPRYATQGREGAALRFGIDVWTKYFDDKT